MKTKRPEQNAQISPDEIKKLMGDLEKAQEVLERHAAHLSALDVRRHNSANIKRQGFIIRSKELAEIREELLPHWLTKDKFERDYNHMVEMQSALDLIDVLRKLASNILVISSDMAYTDALEFYASAREAAARGVDLAEGVKNELSPFFKDLGKRKNENPTQKQIIKDANALLHNKKDGKIIIENISPKEEAGIKKVEDQTYNPDNL